MSCHRQAALLLTVLAAPLVGGCLTGPPSTVIADIRFDNQASALTVSYQIKARTRVVSFTGPGKQGFVEPVAVGQEITFAVTAGTATTSVLCTVGSDMALDKGNGFGVITIAQTSTGVEAACTDNWSQSGLGLTVSGGNGQSGPPGGALQIQVGIPNTIPGGVAVILAWHVTAGGGTLRSPETFAPDLSNDWTLGPAGPQEVTVVAPDGARVIFTATISGTGTSCSGGTAHAPLGGQITADETWTLAQSPHQVPQDLFFDNATLTIEPGGVVCAGELATLTFQNDARLVADGTAAAPIRFTAADPLLGWEGLSLQTLSAGASSLRNVRIELADRGMLVLNHAVVMDSIIVRQSLGVALDLRGGGIEVLRSRVDTTHTPGTAAVILFASDTRFESTVRGAAGIGIEGVMGAGHSLVNCEVFGSGSHGMFLSFSTVSNCNLAGNGGDGIAGLAASPITATGNWWGDAAGPTGPAGDGVSGMVDFSNFLTVPAVVDPRP